MFETIEREAEGIIIEKKSKFIANAFYVESEEEAERILSEVRKKYYDARHNCYAYRIQDKNNILEKQSDDGEPSGTAGAPILNVLSKKELVNVLIIVTRYFGGILLGTGGLTKAYTDSSKKALENTTIIQKGEGYVIELKVEYEDMGRLEYICNKENLKITKKEYMDKVQVEIEILKEKYDEFYTKILKNNFQKTPIKIKEEKII